MGSSGNLSKLLIPKHHWLECKDKTGYMNMCFKETGPDSRGALRAKVQRWVAFSICAGFIVVPLLMFICALDSMEVTTTRQPWLSLDGPRLEFIGVHSRWSVLRGGKMAPSDEESVKSRGALQGMGTLLRTGTRAMQELIVAHLTEDTTSEELRLFLRSLHRSGSTASADVVLLFPSSPTPTAMATVIREEEESFQKLLENFSLAEAVPVEVPSATLDSTITNSSISLFNPAAFKYSGEEEDQEIVQEIIWGSCHGAPEAATDADAKSALSWASWGSMVSFDVQELDPQDALLGFFDTRPVQLRRWVCYDMLLGMIKSRYKNVLVSQVKGVYVLGDALSASRKKQTLYITAEDLVWSDAKREPVAERSSEGTDSNANDEPVKSTVLDLPAARHESIRRILRENRMLKPSDDGDGTDQSPLSSNDDKTRIEGPKLKSTTMKKETWRYAEGLMQSVYGPRVWNSLEQPEKQRPVVSTAVIMGGVQFVRGLANKMTSEIVRVAMDHKSRRPFHDKAVLNMWIHKKSALGKRISDRLKVVRNQDSVVHSVLGSRQPFLMWRKRLGNSRYLVLHQEHAGKPGKFDAISALRQELCELDPSLYQRCS